MYNDPTGMYGVLTSLPDGSPHYNGGNDKKKDKRSEKLASLEYDVPDSEVLIINPPDNPSSYDDSWANDSFDDNAHMEYQENMTRRNREANWQAKAKKLLEYYQSAEYKQKVEQEFRDREQAERKIMDAARAASMSNDAGGDVISSTDASRIKQGYNDLLTSLDNILNGTDLKEKYGLSCGTLPDLGFGGLTKGSSLLKVGIGVKFKLGGGGKLQPYNPITGKYIKFNPLGNFYTKIKDASLSKSGSFFTGIAQGYMKGKSGVEIPLAFTRSQKFGQIIGELFGSIF